MTLIALGLVVFLFGGMAAIFGWLELREWRRIRRELNAELEELLTTDGDVLTKR
jgi:hypothetical protein